MRFIRVFLASAAFAAVAAVPFVGLWLVNCGPAWLAQPGDRDPYLVFMLGCVAVAGLFFAAGVGLLRDRPPVAGDRPGIPVADAFRVTTTYNSPVWGIMTDHRTVAARNAIDAATKVRGRFPADTVVGIEVRRP